MLLGRARRAQRHAPPPDSTCTSEYVRQVEPVALVDLAPHTANTRDLIKRSGCVSHFLSLKIHD